MTQFITIIVCLGIVTYLAYENRDLKEENATLKAVVPKRDATGKFAKKVK